MRLARAATLLGLVLILGAPSWAREKKVKIDELPPAVKQTVLDVSRGLKIHELTRETENNETFYEVELKVDDHIRDVIINADGVVVLVEEEVEWSLVPAAVQATIKKEAQGRKILFVETLTRNDQIEAYEAHVRKGWWREMEVKVDPQGEVIEEK